MSSDRCCAVGGRDRGTESDEEDADEAAREGTDQGATAGSWVGRLGATEGPGGAGGPGDSGPNTPEQYEREYGVDVDSYGEAETVQRLESRHGPRQVQAWADEGMPVAAMGSPSKRQRYRDRADTPVPWDVESFNRQSRRRNTSVVQRAAREGSAGDTGVPDSVRDVVSSRGKPLDGVVQRTMEDRMGEEFGDVRVHTGPRAAGACNDLCARAFTVGNHVAFDRGEYDPESAEGRHVIAHELAHVRQQTGGGLSMLPREELDAASMAVDPDPELEDEARETARRVTRGETDDRVATQTTGVHVQRMRPAHHGPAAHHGHGAGAHVSLVPVEPVNVENPGQDDVRRLTGALREIVREHQGELGVERFPNTRLIQFLEGKGIQRASLLPYRDQIRAPRLGEQVSNLLGLLAERVRNSGARERDLARGQWEQHRQWFRDIGAAEADVREREDQARRAEQDRDRERRRTYADSRGTRNELTANWWAGFPAWFRGGDRYREWQQRRTEIQERHEGPGAPGEPGVPSGHRENLNRRVEQNRAYINARDESASWRRIKWQVWGQVERGQNNTRDIEPQWDSAARTHGTVEGLSGQVGDPGGVTDPDVVNEKIDKLARQFDNRAKVQGHRETIERLRGRSRDESRNWHQGDVNTFKKWLSYLSNLSAGVMSTLPWIEAQPEGSVARSYGWLPMGLLTERLSNLGECPHCGHSNNTFLAGGAIGAGLGTFLSQGMDNVSDMFVTEAALAEGLPFVGNWAEGNMERYRQRRQAGGGLHVDVQICERCGGRIEAGTNVARLLNMQPFGRIPGLATPWEPQGEEQTRDVQWGEHDPPLPDHVQQQTRGWRQYLQQTWWKLGDMAGWGQVGIDWGQARRVREGLGKPFDILDAKILGPIFAALGPLLSKPLQCPRPGCNGHIGRYVLNTANITRNVAVALAKLISAGNPAAIRLARGAGTITGLGSGQLIGHIYRVITNQVGSGNPFTGQCELCGWEWNMGSEVWEYVYDKFDSSTMNADDVNYFEHSEWTVDSTRRDIENANRLATDHGFTREEGGVARPDREMFLNPVRNL